MGHKHDKKDDLDDVLDNEVEHEDDDLKRGAALFQALFGRPRGGRHHLRRETR